MTVSLVAVTSHEMRAPLAAIRGFVDMLQRRRAELSDAEVEEFLQVISAQTDRLIRLADDLVTMESLDDASLTIEHEPIVLVPALEQLVRELPGGDRVELRVSADTPPTIESDALRLGQVLTNLLTNALKYSDEGAGVTVEVASAPAPTASRSRSSTTASASMPTSAIGCSSPSIARPRALVRPRDRASGSRSRGGSSTRSAATSRPSPRRAEARPSGSRFRFVRRRAEHLLDRLEQRDRAERLREVLVRAHRDRALAALLAVGRHDDHPHAGRRGIGPNLARAPRPRSTRGCSCRGRRGLAGRPRTISSARWPSAASSIGESLALEHEPHRLAHRRVVLDDEDPGVGHARSPRASRTAGGRRTRRASNGRRSSAPSPTPTKRTGTPSSSRTASTMPPLADPSVFVSTTPVTSTASVNALACAMPFCPVCASRTSRVSSTCAARLLDHAS